MAITDDILEAAHLTAAEIRLELALLLFERDRLTLMQAARLADMRPLPFQQLLASRGISPHYDVEEFEQDLIVLRQGALQRP